MEKKAHALYEDCAATFYVEGVPAQQVGCAKLEVCRLRISHCIKGTIPKKVLQCRCTSVAVLHTAGSHVCSQFCFLRSTGLVQWRSVKASGPVKWLHDTRRLRNSCLSLDDESKSVLLLSGRIRSFCGLRIFKGSMPVAGSVVLLVCQGGATKEQQEEVSSTRAEAARKSCRKNRFDLDACPGKICPLTI